MIQVVSNYWHTRRSYKLGSESPCSSSPYHLYLTMLRQQVLTFPRVPTLKERLLDIIERSHHSIQAFDPRTRSLMTFPWYILIH